MHQSKKRLFTELELLENRRLLTTASVDASRTLNIQGTGSSETIFVNRKSNGKVSVTGVAAQFTMGSGSGQFNKINITASGGNDNVSISNNVNYISATIAGGTGNDTLGGGKGNDLISGNDGHDRLDGASAGADTLTGGSGLDTANYSSRTDPLKITLDGASNDGGSNGAEGDNVQTEEVLGGSGNDTITGSSADDYISGGAGADSLTGNGGNDVITGSTGSDRMFGNAGDDFLQAQNQDGDVVNGGTNPGGAPDFDLASIDEIDTPNFTKAPPPANAGDNPSDTDSSFGVDGKVLGPDFGWDYTNAATMDSKGRIIFVGGQYGEDTGYDFVAVRYNADGSVDESFGDMGVATIDFTEGEVNTFGEGWVDDDIAYGVTVDANDNVIVVGRSYAYSFERFDSDFAVAKLLEADGSLDESFSGDGRARFDMVDQFTSDNASDVVVQTDGNIVVVGTAELAGVIDLGPDDSDIAAIRITPLGNLDDNFNNGNPHLVNIGGYDYASSVALQTFPADEGAQRIVIGGSTDDDFAVVRLTSTGEVDTSFDGSGVSVRDFGAYESLNDLAVGPDNEIYAVGATDDRTPALQDAVGGVLVRYSPNGDFIDLRVEESGNFLTYSSVAVQPDGRIVVGGDNGEDFVLARYNPSDLTFDQDFAPGLVFTDFTDIEDEFPDTDICFAVFVRPEGQIVQAGLNNVFSEGDEQIAMVQFNGGNFEKDGEISIDEVEKIVNDDDVFGNPADPDVQKALGKLSDLGKFNVLAQPKSDGSVYIPLTDGNDIVTFQTIEDGEGNEVLAVNVNGVVLYYRQDGGLPPGFAPGGDSATLLTFDAKKGNDQILGNSNVLIPLELNMGDGNDTVIGGELADVIFGGVGNDSIEAQNGNDIVIGGDGNDKLKGSGGRDLVIGGKGKDDLSGGSSDDIVIAGNTSHDTSIASLKDLLAEWESGNDYPTRISNILNGGGANGSTRLIVSGAGKNVFNDSSTDTLKGADGRDWFIRSTSTANDVLTDRKSDETITTV